MLIDPDVQRTVDDVDSPRSPTINVELESSPLAQGPGKQRCVAVEKALPLRTTPDLIKEHPQRRSGTHVEGQLSTAVSIDPDVEMKYDAAGVARPLIIDFELERSLLAQSVEPSGDGSTESGLSSTGSDTDSEPPPLKRIILARDRQQKLHPD
jgi:hypothetical protein